MADARAASVPRKPADPTPHGSSAERRILQFGMLDDLIGFHMRLAVVAVYRDFTRATRGLGVSQTQFAILEIVQCNLGVSQVDIANALSMDKATMMSLVDRLEKAGLMVRRASKTDRRRQELFLTENGQAMVTTMRTTIIEHERAISADLTDADVTRLIASLRKVHERNKDRDQVFVPAPDSHRSFA